MTKKKFSPVGKNSPLTPEQITAYNTSRTRDYRERQRIKLGTKCRPRANLTRREQLDRLYKAINRPAMSYTVPPGEHYYPHPTGDTHSAEYTRLYNLARHNPQLTKEKAEYRPRTTPYVRKSRRCNGRLGRPVKETRWSGLAPTIRPSILRKNKLLSKSVHRPNGDAPRPAIPRGTLTQTMLHEIMDYVPHLGEFWWISGQRTGNEAGYDRHLTHTREHKGAKYPAHAPKRFADPYAGLRPQRATSPHPPRSYPGGHIITGRTRELHPVDKNNNPICKPAIKLTIHTTTRDANGLEHITHDFHLVRPYNPMRVITVGGVTYPAWQLAILWMGAGCKWLYAYGAVAPTPVPSRADLREQVGEGCKGNDEPDTNVDLTFTMLDGRPAPPVFRDGNTLNLTWDNIRPDLPPIMPTQEMLIAAQRKYDKKYAKLKQQERTFKALSAENKRKALSDKMRKERIAREKRQLRESTKYNQDKCITKTTFNKVQNKWVVAIPYQEKQVFFSEADAIAHHTQVIEELTRKGKINNTHIKSQNNTD